MTSIPKSLVLSKLSIILSSSLAHNNSGRLEWVRAMHSGSFPSSPLSLPENTTIPEGTNASCTDPCADLNEAIHSELLVLLPTGIGLVCSLLAVLPTLIQRSKNRVMGIKGYLWVLLQLWLHLLITHYLFTQRKDKAQAYVWALHSASHVLSSWAPRRGTVKHPGLHYAMTTIGAVSVALFAWQIGPGVGLAAWYRKGDALCGWSVHLVAVLGVEVVQWVLSPVESLIVSG